MGPPQNGWGVGVVALSGVPTVTVHVAGRDNGVDAGNAGPSGRVA